MGKPTEDCFWMPGVACSETKTCHPEFSMNIGCALIGVKTILSNQNANLNAIRKEAISLAIYDMLDEYINDNKFDKSANDMLEDIWPELAKRNGWVTDVPTNNPWKTNQKSK